MTNSPRWLPIVGVLALLWNAVGVYSYLGFVGLAPAMEPPSAVPMPLIAHSGYAVGVFGAVLGSLGLILRKRWTRAVLWISLIGLILDFGWVFGLSGQGVTPLGVTVLVIALALALLADHATKRGWLN